MVIAVLNVIHLLVLMDIGWKNNHAMESIIRDRVLDHMIM